MVGINVAIEYDERQEVNALTPVYIHVVNNDALPVAIKVLTRHVDWYHVSPSKAFIGPRSRVTLEVKQTPPAEFATEDSAASFVTSAFPPEEERLHVDLVRVELRVMISSSADVAELPLDTFADHWKRAVEQAPQTLELKLGWTTPEQFIAHRHAEEKAKADEARKVADELIAIAEKAEQELRYAQQRHEGYEHDLAVAALRLEQRRSVVGVHWSVALVASFAAFAAGCGPEAIRTMAFSSGLPL
jgi:hypothetical protein